jgi:integration host factor subunit alpha
VVALHGAQQRSGIEKNGKSVKCRIADNTEFRYEGVTDSGGGADKRRETKMADLGIARLNKDSDVNGTLTRADLADVVHHKLGLSRAESASVVERVLHHMCHALSEGQNVKISGFGTFILRDKGERIGRNPKTGIEVPIAPRRVMTFRASQIMRDRIAR